MPDVEGMITSIKRATAKSGNDYLKIMVEGQLIFVWNRIDDVEKIYNVGDDVKITYTEKGSFKTCARISKLAINTEEPVKPKMRRIEYDSDGNLIEPKKRELASVPKQVSPMNEGNPMIRVPEMIYKYVERVGEISTFDLILWITMMSGLEDDELVAEDYIRGMLQAGDLMHSKSGKVMVNK